MSKYFVITTISVLAISIIALYILYRAKKRNQMEISKKIPKYLQITKQFNESLTCFKRSYISYRQFKSLEHEFKTSARVINTFPKKIRTKPEFAEFLTTYKNLRKVIDTLNEEYITRELQEKSNFFNNISGKSLDEQQRLICVTDEDNSLVIAGAGSGKSLTLNGKIKYLIEQKSVKQEDILLVSFSNKITTDLKKKIGANYPNIKISTLHSLGLKIIRENDSKIISVADNNFLERIISNYFIDIYDINRDAICRILEFFSSYFDTDNGCQNESDNAFDIYQTIRGETLKSLAEVHIANYLYLHSVEYKYEELYKYSPSDKPYHPDFYLSEYDDLYIEHFGIDKDGHAPPFGEEREKEYHKQIIWKRNLHKEKKTKLIETYGYYESEGTLCAKLEEDLKKYGVTLKPRSRKELIVAFKALSLSKKFTRFRQLLLSFISLYKSKGYSKIPKYTFSNSLKLLSGLEKRRTELFLDIVSDIYQEYENKLNESNQVDYSDMILKATAFVENHGKVHNFRYILVDEYQDTSVAQYKLLHALYKETGAKILCAGDDWQSIYRFNGSEIDLFLNFDKYFSHPKIHKIEKTYRNSQELLDIISPFIKENPSQIPKSMVSEIHVLNPIRILQYGKIMLDQLSSIIDCLAHDIGEDASVLILSRTNNDLNENITSINLGPDFSVKRMKSEIIVSSNKHPLMKINPMTVHKSKGLEADAVIILNMSDNLLGFPSKLIGSSLLSLVSQNSENYPFAEERRLFYVAVTRAKKIVYLLTPKSIQNQSIFLKEINSIMERQKPIA